MNFTIEELRKCAERELRRRQHVYPQRVYTGRMRQDTADWGIAQMAAIIDLLRKQEKAELLPLDN